MHLNDTKEAMPWVGLYIAGASLACTLAMAADAFLGIRQWKLWFPNKFFAMNSASISLIAIAMKLPVDLSYDEYNANFTKFCSILFLVVMLANCLPSLGLMGDKELLANMIAWGIFLITIAVNLLIQILAGQQLIFGPVLFFLLFYSLLLVFSIALTVPTSRRISEHEYQQELYKDLASCPHITFSFKELEHKVKKYWIMADTVTGNHQLLIACSEISSAFGVICAVFVFLSLLYLKDFLFDQSDPNSIYHSEDSDYKWSVKLIIIVQLFGVVVGSIAPIFRCLTSISHFNLSMKLIKNHLNVFRVEKRWIQMFQVLKLIHVSSHIPGRHCKITFNFFKNVILNFCIALQVMVVVTCKITCLVPVLFGLLLSRCWYVAGTCTCANVSHVNVRSEMEYYHYLYVVEDVKPSERVIKSTLNPITRLLHASEKEKPKNLIKLLTKSKGFSGVLKFDNEKVRPLYSEEAQNYSWSLVAVTLTAIAVALPNIAKDNVKGLLVSMTEGLEFVKHIEEILNVNKELVKARLASRRVGIEVAVYHTWLQSDLKKKAREGKTSKDILQWLGDRAAKIVESKSNKIGSQDYSYKDVLSANSMYRISQTILIHCSEQEEWPTDEEVFEWVSKIIADILLACFTNLPCVITKYAIEKRQGDIRTATRILGKSKVILNILEERQLPNLDRDSMAYLDKWHALPKSQILEDSPSLNESLELTIM